MFLAEELFFTRVVWTFILFRRAWRGYVEQLLASLAFHHAGRSFECFALERIHCSYISFLCSEKLRGCEKHRILVLKTELREDACQLFALSGVYGILDWST